MANQTSQYNNRIRARNEARSRAEQEAKASRRELERRRRPDYDPPPAFRRLLPLSVITSLWR